MPGQTAEAVDELRVNIAANVRMAPAIIARALVEHRVTMRFSRLNRMKVGLISGECGIPSGTHQVRGGSLSKVDIAR
jgi:hypothetical protein